MKLIKLFSLSLTTTLAFQSNIFAAEKKVPTLVYTNDLDPSYVLTIRQDLTANIIHKVKAPNGKITPDTLIEGTWNRFMDNSYEIRREEGDVCPSVSVILLQDGQGRVNQAALVRAKTEDAGSAIRECGDVESLNGTYVLTKNTENKTAKKAKK